MTVVQTFVARPGARISNGDAEIIGTYLDRLRPDGQVKAPEFVELARPESSVLHGYLEWRDGVAAEQYRLVQARKIMASILVVTPTSGPTRAYHSVVINRSGERAYVKQEIVFTVPRLRKQVVERAVRELRYWADKYREYAELAGIIESIQSEIDQITGEV